MTTLIMKISNVYRNQNQQSGIHINDLSNFLADNEKVTYKQRCTRTSAAFDIVCPSQYSSGVENRKAVFVYLWDTKTFLHIYL